MSQEYSQLILHVDLSTKELWREEIDSEIIAKYLGGRGIAAKLLWDGVKKGTDPLGSDNLLILAAGTLTGTNAPAASKLTVTTRGAQTGIFLKTCASGHFGAALRRTGYHLVVVHGVSNRPTHLWIDRERVELRDAAHLWGKTIRETNRALEAEADGPIEVACIGPAGENGVKFASIMFSYYDTAGRGGAGAVMGSKKLKAIVVDGEHGEVAVARPEEFSGVVNRAREALYKDSYSRRLFDYGTPADVDLYNALHLMPSYNFNRSYIDDSEAVRGLSGSTWSRKERYLKNRRGCSACTITCHPLTEVNVGPYTGAYSGGPHFTAVLALGPRCGNTSIDLVCRMNELCNEMGMDVNTTGAVIAWLMESYEKGLVGDQELDGLKPEWGSGEAMVELLRRIVHREGVGDLLADGTRVAAERVGGDSYQWTMEIKGLEITGVELRAAYSWALAYAVNSRGGDHLYSTPNAEFGGTPEARALMQRIAGDAKYLGGTVIEKRAEIVNWHEDMYAVADALGLCVFTTHAAYGIDEERAALLFQYATGIEMTADQIMEAGRRIVTLERCFNMREGLSRKNDTLPWRIMHEDQEDLDMEEGAILPQERLDIMLDEYYRLRGWDRESGRPTEATLRQLGLGFVTEGVVARPPHRTPLS